jgi:oligopeptide transport system ATP-binding protein
MPAPAANAVPLLRVDGLRTYLPVRRGMLRRGPQYLKAVDDVSFELQRGQTLGLVGESGCGKTTLARTILRLIPPTAGTVYFEGRDVGALRGAELRAFRRRAQIIFQDPVASLNPRLRVETIVGEALTVHGLARSARERRERVAQLLTRVGLPAEALHRYPHEFSGGQRQRIGIARALALEPSLIVCDEPVSALDVSIQAQILNLLADLRRDFGLSYLFIAHNLAVVQHISDAVAVMYLGKIVEQAPTAALFSDPRHPYTQALLAAVPDLPASAAVPDMAGLPHAAEPPANVEEPPRALNPKSKIQNPKSVLPGEPPSPLDPPAGCAFHPRCPYAQSLCEREAPRLEARPGVAREHLVACHFPTEAGRQVGQDGNHPSQPLGTTSVPNAHVVRDALSCDPATADTASIRRPPPRRP